MTVKLLQPYKIAALRAKRYETHYNIPAERSLVVPRKTLGEEVACDIRWVDENGEGHLLENKVFVAANLIAINPMLEDKLFELWKKHYEGQTASVPQEGQSIKEHI